MSSSAGILAEKVALITGAARGQGEAEALLFASEGATVVVADTLVQQGNAVVDSLIEAGHRALFIELDVSSESAWAEAVSTIESTFGRLDILVNNAGISDRRGIEDHDFESWRRVIDINLWGPVAGMQACAPLMGQSGGGSIINVSSIAGMTGFHGAAYTPSKWGLRGVTKTASLEFAPLGIRVNSVHPGTIATPMISNATEEFVEHFLRVNADPRAAAPIEMARTVLHLASDNSSYMTGAEVVVDGGFLSAGAHRGLALRIAELEEEQA